MMLRLAFHNKPMLNHWSTSIAAAAAADGDVNLQYLHKCCLQLIAINIHNRASNNFAQTEQISKQQHNKQFLNHKHCYLAVAVANNSKYGNISSNHLAFSGNIRFLTKLLQASLIFAASIGFASFTALADIVCFFLSLQKMQMCCVPNQWCLCCFALALFVYFD